MNTRGAPLQLCIQVMDYDYWFNNLWYETTQLDVFGGQYAAFWEGDGFVTYEFKQVLSGPAPAPVLPDDEDDILF